MRVGVEPEGAPIASRSAVAEPSGIVLEMLGDRLIGRDRLRARAERRLVRRELEHPRDAGRRALARHVGLDVEHAGARLRTLRQRTFMSAPEQISQRLSARGRARSADPIAGRVAADEGRGAHRGAGLDQRVDDRARCCRPAAPRPAAPRRRRRGRAPRSTSASGASACAAAALQPATRTLHISTSVTMASGAAREITNTGRAAGWSARSTNGSRAMIFGAVSNSSALHQAPAPAVAKAGTRPRSPFEFGDRRDHAGGAHVRHERHREAEMEARGVAHRGVAGRQVGMHRERRLHIGEGRDDDAPDALDGVERQDAVVALDQPAHHVGLARRAEGGAASPASA